MRKVLGCLLTVILLVAPVFGQEAGQDLGNWWLKSSLSFDPMPEKLLSHFEGTASYMEMEGNTDGDTMSGNAAVVLRKSRCTSKTEFTYSKQGDMELSGGRGSMAEQESRNVGETITVDVLKWLSAVIGYRNDMDDATYIENRDTYFGGLGVTWARGPVVLNVFAGYGNDEVEYDVNSPALAMGVANAEEESGGIYCQSVARWQVTKTVALQQTSGYLDYTDSEMGKRWDLTVGADIAIAKHIFLNVSRNVKYEDNTIVSAIGKRKDITQSVGLKISY